MKYRVSVQRVPDPPQITISTGAFWAATLGQSAPVAATILQNFSTRFKIDLTAQILARHLSSFSACRPVYVILFNWCCYPRRRQGIVYAKHLIKHEIEQIFQRVAVHKHTSKIHLPQIISHMKLYWLWFFGSSWRFISQEFPNQEDLAVRKWLFG